MLSATFAALALTLAAIGLYGVLACTVSADDRNRSPNGPGGNGSEVFRVVIDEGLRLTAAGLVFGIAGSIAIGRLLTTMLSGSDREISGYLRGLRPSWSRQPRSP
jgi:putative ABC transport system permease protein